MKSTCINLHRGLPTQRHRKDRQEPAEDDGWDPETVEDLLWEEERELKGSFVLDFVRGELRSGPFEFQLGAMIEWGDAGILPVPRSELERSGPPTMEAVLLIKESRDSRMPTSETKAKWRQIAATIGSTGALENLAGKSLSFEEEDLLTVLLTSQHLWRRPLSCWSKPTGTRLEVLISLAKHLLEQYPVPGWLDAWSILKRNSNSTPYQHIDSAWYDDGDPIGAPWIAYIAATQGVKLGPVFQYCARIWQLEIPASAARHAFEVPPLTDVEKAFVWMLVRSMGGSFDTASKFAMNYWNRCDGWTLPLIRYIVRHPEMVEHVNDIHDWVLHMDIEARRVNPGVGFQLAGRSPARVLAAATAYWFSIRTNQASHCSWNSHGWDTRFEEAMVSWAFVELLNSGSLSEESSILRHCVGSYADACVQNQSAIVSVRAGGRRVLTVEVDPATGLIIQVHGFANRNATEAEVRVVKRWSAQFGLVYNPVNFRLC